MRKHFLILMLLTLLPLAGWATDITNLLVGFGDVTKTYSAVAQELPTPLTIGGVDIPDGKIIDLQWYKGTVAPANEIAKTGDVFKFTDAGVYMCTFRINDAGYEGQATGTFEVAKKTLTVTAGNINLTYGDAAPTSQYAVTFTGWPVGLYRAQEAGESAEDYAAYKKGVEDALIATFGDEEYTTTYTQGKPVGNYNLIPVVADRLTSNNYNFSTVNGTIAVAQKSFEAEGVHFTATVNDMVYAGSDRKPVPTVTDGDLNTTLNYHVEGANPPADDFVLTYHTSQANAEGNVVAAADALTNVNTYWVKITGTGNYTGSIIKSYKVTQKSLWITTKSGNTDYAGVAIADYRTNLAGFALFEGLVDGDAEDNGTPKAATYKAGASIKINMKQGATTYDYSDGKKPVNAGDYNVIFAPSTTDKTAIFTNYKVVYIESGVYTINKVNLTVTARNDLGMNYGETTPLTAGVVPTDDNKDDYIDEIDGFVNSEKFSTYPKLKLGEMNEDGTYPINVDFTDAKIGSKAIANYNLIAVPGLFTIAKGQMAVRPVNVTDAVYGEAQKTLSVLAFGGSSDDNTAVENFLKDALVINEEGVSLTDNNVDVEWPAAGIYNISFDLTKVDAATLATWTAKYEFEYFNESTYTINKAPLTITLNAQALNVNDGVAALKANNKTVSFETLVNGDKAADLYEDIDFAFAGHVLDKVKFTKDQVFDAKTAWDGLGAEANLTDAVLPLLNAVAANEYDNTKKKNQVQAADVTAFNTAAAEGVDGSTDPSSIDTTTPAYLTTNKLNAAAAAYDGDDADVEGYFEGGITLANTTVFANYKWTANDVVKGDLFVSADADLALDEQEVTDATAAPAPTVSAADRLEAANNQKKNVDVTLYRKQTISTTTYTWNPQQFNALVLPFDVTVAELSEQFGYAIVNVVNPEKTTEGNIYWSLAWGTIDANTPFVVRTVDAIDGENGTTISFTAKTIKYEEAPEVEAGQGYKVVGAYSPVVIDKTSAGKKRFFGNNTDHGIGASSDFTWTIYPFDAYLDYTGNASGREVTLTFEDLNGGTTSISAAEFNRNAVSAEGWYTINGMKLEGMPTEKGIYIQNGKKVVIK